ncbi:MAG: hypothetical protein GWN58_18375, partial [Anaerolineae bacterium]|nr:hypothetical protein [Anaerolineae bacterium]
RRFHPDMPACLYSNSVSAPDFDLVRKYESVNAEYEHNEIFLDRVRCLATAPYDHSLFLDADTYVDAPLDGMFCLLDRFDLAARQSTHYTVELEDVPPSFYEYSAG